MTKGEWVFFYALTLAHPTFGLAMTKGE